LFWNLTTLFTSRGNDLAELGRRGHTLIAAGTGSAINSLITHYGVSLTSWHYTSSLSQTTPALSNPPFATIEPSSAIATITISRPDVAVHLVSESGEPVLVSVLYGGGVVWVLGTVYPFTNQGLHTESNARLILNLLAHVPAGAVIGFEEALRTPSEPQAQQQPGGLTAWLVNSRAGWSILAAVGLVMAFLLLRGRRFGQPVRVRVPCEQNESNESERQRAEAEG
jgi:hypothetical protein